MFKSLWTRRYLRNKKKLNIYGLRTKTAMQCKTGTTENVALGHHYYLPSWLEEARDLHHVAWSLVSRVEIGGCWKSQCTLLLLQEAWDSRWERWQQGCLSRDLKDSRTRHRRGLERSGRQRAEGKVCQANGFTKCFHCLKTWYKRWTRQDKTSLYSEDILTCSFGHES